jgi:hypothetical protein
MTGKVAVLAPSPPGLGAAGFGIIFNPRPISEQTSTPSSYLPAGKPVGEVVIGRVLDGEPRAVGRDSVWNAA